MVNSKCYFKFLFRFFCYVPLITFIFIAKVEGADRCLEFNTDTLTIQTSGSKLLVTADGPLEWLASFELSESEHAEKTLAIIQHYNFNRLCWLTDSEPLYSYFLSVEKRSSPGTVPGEDCTTMADPYVDVHPSTGDWAILSKSTDGFDRIKVHFLFGSNESAAHDALSRIQEFFFTRSCSVGRPSAMSYLRPGPDSDGDGLLDRWETHGFDADGDGIIDVDLPAFGADPNHKDIFLEFDWMTGEEPTQAAIRAVKQAFAAAPIDAGGSPNPDGLPGINLWIDTGSLTDPQGIEDAGAVGSCSDGIDNGGDGQVDSNDTDCFVGDNFTGGNAMAASDIPGLSPDFYNSKAVNFNNNRSAIFRYALSARPNVDGVGGQGEIGGNDFIDFNHDDGSIMHELGHTLNLRHGGNDGNNCKPNYVSVMNYDNVWGIYQLGGGKIIDFSPPRFPGGRGQAPLNALEENDLDEASILDGTDSVNQFVFMNGNGQKVRSQLDQAVDWNGDGDTDDWGLTVNIDDPLGSLLPCDNTTSDSTLTGHDDWSEIVLDFRPFGDSLDGPINPVTEPEPNMQELHALNLELNTTDLEITATDTSDPVEAGNTLTYSLMIANNGPNPADQVRVTDILPAGVTYQNNNAGCIEGSVGTLTCELGVMPAFDFRSIAITVLVDPAIGPTVITNSATVVNLAGPDGLSANNNSSEDTTVIDTTPPVLSIPSDAILEAGAQCTATGYIGSAIAIDIVDPSPELRNDSTGVFQLGNNEITWTATDDSGNSSSAIQVVTVIDVTPPSITASVSPDVLWPPNHKMVNIVPSITASDNCSISVQQLKKIIMNEGDETNTYEPVLDSSVGDGNTSNDIQINSDGIISLRAERSGRGDGRVYSLTFSVTDGSGNKAEASSLVKVPHSL